MTNAQANQRAASAVRRFMSVRDEGGSPIQQDMASWEVQDCILEGIAYAFRQGAKPSWWDQGGESQ